MRTIAMVFLVACGGDAEGDGTPPPPTEPVLGDYQRDCDDVTDCVLVEVPESDPCSGCGGYWAALRYSDAAAYQEAADAFEDASECLDGPQAGCACSDPMSEADALAALSCTRWKVCEVAGDTCR